MKSPPNPRKASEGVFASFSIRSFRFQWFADVLSTWGFEMETLILSWYILVETDSPVLLAAVGALRFCGTLFCPFAGVIADRFSLRQVMVCLRVVLTLLALVIIVSDAMGVLGPAIIFFVAAGTGLLRPAEQVIRNALIAETVPEGMLANAVGYSRATTDSARVVGALAGAGLLVAIGIAWAYTVITVMYLATIALTFKVTNLPPYARSPATPVKDLVSGFKYVHNDRLIRLMMWLALLANVTAFPLTHGLLPVVAREIYGLGEVGLASMLAVAAVGSLIGSLFVAGGLKTGRAETFMLIGMVGWHVLVWIFVVLPPSTFAWMVLGVLGFASSAAMSTMAVSLLNHAKPAYRGRVMGVRMLAVYGLPVGLMLGGFLTEEFGVVTTLSWYGGIGLVLSVWAMIRWKALTEPRFVKQFD